MDLLSILAMFKTERISPLISHLYSPSPTDGNPSRGIPSPYLSRLASVSEAGASWRNPEPKEGPCRDWRRERDSNPRYGFPYSGFQDRLFQPLTHPSAGLISAV